MGILERQGDAGMKMMAGYFVVRDGRTMIRGSINCDMDKKPKSAQDDGIVWVKEFVRLRWKLTSNDEVNIIGFMPTSRRAR
jgi:hypothetical protein